MKTSKGKAFQAEKNSKLKRIWISDSHMPQPQRLAKQRPLQFLSFKMRPDYNMIEFSILTCLWRKKGTAIAHIVSLCELEKKKTTRLQVNVSLYQGAQLGDWSVGWFQSSFTASARCPCTGHNLHGIILTERLLLHEIIKYLPCFQLY